MSAGLLGILKGPTLLIAQGGQPLEADRRLRRPRRPGELGEGARACLMCREGGKDNPATDRARPWHHGGSESPIHTASASLRVMVNRMSSVGKPTTAPREQTGPRQNWTHAGCRIRIRWRAAGRRNRSARRTRGDRRPRAARRPKAWCSIFVLSLDSLNEP